MTLAELNEIKKNYKVLEIAVDFINPSYNISRAKHLDTARYLLCTLTENGVPRTVKDNEVARIRLQKPDKTYIYNDCDIIEDGRVLITLTEQILAVEGNAVCDIQLTDEETGIIYSTKNFIVNIDKTAVDNSVIESSNEFDALNNLISTNKKLNEELETNEEIRNANEDERIKNENIRQKNESNRGIAEIKREDAESIRVENENIRKANEIIRQDQESDRQTNTATAIANAEAATKRANDATDDLQGKLDSHHFVLTEDKDIAGGVPSLDSNTKVPIVELYEATTTGKGVTQLEDSITSTSITSAATPNSVKQIYDLLIKSDSTIITNEDIDKIFGDLIYSNYGDGSLNAVTGGYNGKLIDYEGNVITSTGVGYYAGNLRLDNNTSFVGIGGIYNTFKPLVKGFLDSACEKVVLCEITSNVTGVKTFANSAGNIPSNKYVVYWMDQGAWGSPCSIYNFYITKSGTNYTLKNAVTEGIIQPMVIMLSASTSSSYYFKEILNVYTGGKASNSYSNAMVVFVTKEEIDSFTVTTTGRAEGVVWVAYCDPSYGVFYCE